jgi:hypothetical protein
MKLNVNYRRETGAIDGSINNEKDLVSAINLFYILLRGNLLKFTL